MTSLYPRTQCPWFFNPGYIDVQRAYSLAVLGCHREAAAAFSAAIAALPAGFHRDRGGYLARQAAAHAAAGEVDQAGTCSLRALAAGVETDSGRIMTVLTQLDAATARWRASAACLGELHRVLESTGSRPGS